MPSPSRPLSPHLQVYRPQLTSVLSITHRISGVALAVGTPLLVYWLMALAAGRENYERAAALFGSPLLQLALFAWTWALFYHLCNGIRHLWWDAGRGMEIEAVYRSGHLVLGGSVALTLVTWILS